MLLKGLSCQLGLLCNSWRTNERSASSCLDGVGHLALSYCIYVHILSPSLSVALSSAIIIPTLWAFLCASAGAFCPIFQSTIHLFVWFPLLATCLSPFLTVSFSPSFICLQPFSSLSLTISFSHHFLPLSLRPSTLVLFIIFSPFLPLPSPSCSLLPILVPVEKLLYPYHTIRWKHDPEIPEQKDHLWSVEEPLRLKPGLSDYPADSQQSGQWEVAGQGQTTQD